MRDKWTDTIHAKIAVPAHIRACANACLYDLVHGPSFVRIPWGNVENVANDDPATYRDDLEDECEYACGDVIEETYPGRVGDAVRAFIDDLPSEVWVDTDCDDLMLTEPDEYEANPDHTGEDDLETNGPEVYENDLSSTYHLGRHDIIRALFGATFAREFS